MNIHWKSLTPRTVYNFKKISKCCKIIATDIRNHISPQCSLVSLRKKMTRLIIQFHFEIKVVMFFFFLHNKDGEKKSGMRKILSSTKYKGVVSSGSGIPFIYLARNWVSVFCVKRNRTIKWYSFLFLLNYHLSFRVRAIAWRSPPYLSQNLRAPLSVWKTSPLMRRKLCTAASTSTRGRSIAWWPRSAHWRMKWVLENIENHTTLPLQYQIGSRTKNLLSWNWGTMISWTIWVHDCHEGELGTVKSFTRENQTTLLANAANWKAVQNQTSKRIKFCRYFNF